MNYYGYVCFVFDMLDSLVWLDDALEFLLYMKKNQFIYLLWPELALVAHSIGHVIMLAQHD
jgi:hypothetical protein